MPLAIPLAGLGLVVGAVLALLFLLSYAYVKDFTTKALSAIPFIGSWVASHVVSLLDSIWAETADLWNAAVGHFDALIATLYYPIDQITIGAKAALQALVGTANWLALVAIPDAASWVYRAAVDGIDGLKAWATATIDLVVLWATDAFNAVYAWAHTTFALLAFWATVELHNVESWAGQAISDLGAWTSSELTTLETWTIASLSALGSWVSGELSRLETWTTASIATAVAAVYHTVVTETHDELAVVWGAVSGTADVAIHDVGTMFPDVKDLLTNVPAEVPVTLAGMLAGVAAITTPLSIALDRCVMPNCENLSQFGKDLKLLETGAIDVGLLALLAAAIAEPEPTAKVVYDGFVAPLYTVVTDVASVVGIH